MVDQLISQEVLKGVSIIVVIRNRVDSIEQLLKTFLQKNTYRPIEFIIVNQNNEEDISSVIAKYAKNIFIRVIRRSNHSSFAESKNFASKKARFPYLLFLHDDIIYTTDVLPIAVEKLSDPGIGVIGIRLDDDPENLTTGKEPRVQHTGITFEWDNDSEFYRPILINHNSIGESKEFKNGFYPAVTGAFMLCRKTDFEAVHGFYAEYDCGFEDVDLCLLIKEELKKNTYCINEKFLHRIRKSHHDSKEQENLAKDVETFKRRMGERADSIMDALSDRLPQPRPAVQSQPDTGIEELDLNILFVLPVPVDSSMGYQAHQLARMLQAQGASCLIAVPRESNGMTGITDNNPAIQYNSSIPQLTFSSIRENGFPFSNGQTPDIIHAWTPREIVRLFVESIREKHPCPIIIHMQENEEYRTEVTLGRPFSELKRLARQELDEIIPEECYHPTRGRKWLQEVQALTLAIETLNTFNGSSVPYAILPPVVDERLFYPRPLNLTFRKKLGIPDNYMVIVFTGNVHTGNREDVRELYRAVAILNEKDCPAILIRTGINDVELGCEPWITSHEQNLGWVDRSHLPEILASANVLVQPDTPSQINDQHIPTKLPEYFAMGRPVILSRTNLGLKLEHGREGYVLDEPDGEGIADAVQEISKDREMARRLTDGSVEFYLRNCQISVSTTLAFYMRIYYNRNY